MYVRFCTISQLSLAARQLFAPLFPNQADSIGEINNFTLQSMGAADLLQFDELKIKTYPGKGYSQTAE